MAQHGFKNLSQYSGETNGSISMLWSSLERLKNSLATAFAPILTVVAPILSKFIDMLSTAASYVSMFFSFLSGKSTYTMRLLFFRFRHQLLSYLFGCLLLSCHPVLPFLILSTANFLRLMIITPIDNHENLLIFHFLDPQHSIFLSML